MLLLFQRVAQFKPFRGFGKPHAFEAPNRSRAATRRESAPV